jgi:predicted methyltransferase
MSSFLNPLSSLKPRPRLAHRAARLLLLGLALGAALPASSAPVTDDEALVKVLAGSQRTDAERARDVYRHPRQTLEFFGVHPTDRVVEIEPGGGWYTAVLAPYLANNGVYFAVPYVNGSEKSRAEENQNMTLLQKRLQSDPAVFGQASIGVLKGGHISDVGAPGSVDVVLTFRNLHNWVEDGHVDDNLHAFFDILKPGGTLGIEDHRAQPDTPLDRMIKTGYITEDYVIQHAKAAGFVLEDSSPVNNNPKDTKDYADGVWALPPTLRGGSTDRDKYLAIGESDRMTLRFRKPLASQASN